MTAERRAFWWIAAIALVLLALWLVRDILLPFVVGIALGYLLDPAADWLERRGLPRWAAATIITVLALLAVAVAFLVLVPLVQNQVESFIARLPRYMEVARDQITRLIDLLEARLSAEEMKALREKIGAFASPDSLAWVGKALGKVWSGGAALFNLLSLLFITPIVAFFFLRDWDRMVATIDSHIPPHQRATVHEVMRDIDNVLSGFVRGQFLVCLMLGVFYAIGLTLIGLDFGLIIGLVTGLVSFMPYFGMIIGFAIGLGVGLAQFGLSVQLLLVAGVFILGQVIEGNFVTPRLVGNRARLHEVWMIFALLAGGVLAGFLGLLLAVPVAAVIGVLIRFALRRWKESETFRQAGSGGER